MNVSPISNVNARTNFNGLFTKPESIHENDHNIMRNVEKSYYYRFSNEPKTQALDFARKQTDVINLVIDSESDLKFEQGKRMVYKGKLPFSTGEWLQYASFNPSLPKDTQILIEQILKRYGLSHYIRQEAK